MQESRHTAEGRGGAAGFQDRCNSHSANPPSAAAHASYAATDEKVTTSDVAGESHSVAIVRGRSHLATTSSTTTAEWTIRSRQEWPSGTYYELNVRTSGRESAGTVMVKARAKVGPPYVCLTHNLNECEHTRFVALHDTPDSDAGESTRPRNWPAPVGS